jgi:predicted phage-related endonuclease
MAETKSGEAASRKNYMMELLCQRLTGKYEESFTTVAMQWGIDNEDLARAIYELETGYTVKQVGGYPHPKIPMAGASPDGVVISEEGDDIGLVEIKCPNTSMHVDFLQSRKIPKKYQYQMAFQCACSGFIFCDYVSYDPRMPTAHQIAIERFTPSREFIDTIEDKVRAFVSELDELERRFK